MAVVDEAISAAENDAENANARRYDLDWLRVIAFGLLIFYHIGMFYVTWSWHVKSVYASTLIEPLMLIVNPWRLALLFFISGVAIRFATDKAASLRSFALSRLYRLGLPILGGIVVTVAPQAYFELRQSGEIEPDYWTFYGNYLSLEQIYSIITPTWNHLWYVVYLLTYILILAPFFPYLRRAAEGAGGRWLAAATGNVFLLILVPIIPLLLIAYVLEPHFPTTHDLVNDWANHAHRFTIFLFGYVAAKNAQFWAVVRRALPLAAGVAAFMIVLRLYLRSFHEEIYPVIFSGPIPNTIYAWSCILVMFGLAMRFFKAPSPILTYLTSAVFCYYILHQTIIVAAGYYLTQLRLGAGPEFLLIVAITCGGCAAGYELARRIPGLRPWLGVKGGVT